MTSAEMFQSLSAAFPTKVVEMIPDLEGDPNPTLQVHTGEGGLVCSWRCQNITDGSWGPVEVNIESCWMVTLILYLPWSSDKRVLTTENEVVNVVGRLLGLASSKEA